jgi:hypothetical protein
VTPPRPSRILALSFLFACAACAAVYPELQTPLRTPAGGARWADRAPADLRHLSGQLAADAGLADSRIQPHLRHATAAMTRRYSKRQDKQVIPLLAAIIYRALDLRAGPLDSIVHRGRSRDIALAG